LHSRRGHASFFRPRLASHLVAAVSCCTGVLSVITPTAETSIRLRGIWTAVIWATGLPRRVMRTLSPGSGALDQLAKVRLGIDKISLTI
jgi:hypothetical protein